MTLNNEQLTILFNKLIDKLIDTNKNVFQVASDVFGVEVDEDVFDQLEEMGIFKCCACEMWLGIAEKDCYDTCYTCTNEED